MEDLRLAILLMALLSVIIYFGVSRLARNLGPRWLDMLAVIFVILIGLYVRWVWGQLWIVEWIPLASVIVLANWFPLLLGGLAAVLWQRMKPHPLWRKLPVQALLIAVTIWSVVYVVTGQELECGNEWIEPRGPLPYRICLQTTKYTCSAAASATLLEALGIPATEGEMAKLCLTREGTTWLGMYHGLKVKMRGTNFTPEFFEGTPDDLEQHSRAYPVLLCCELTQETAAWEPDYAADDGWIPGVAHTVVYFGLRGGFTMIGDPSQKDLEFWRKEDVENLWTGMGIRVVEKR